MKTSQTLRTTALALAVTVLFTTSHSSVLASNLELAQLETTLQKSLDSMTCDESKSFIRDHIAPQALDSLPANVSSKLDHDHDKCSTSKRIIHDVVSESFETRESESGDVHTTIFLPPISCLECAASLCLNVGFCLHCCLSGHQPICYICP